MRAIYRKIHHARYLYIKRNVEKVWGARYTLGARYLSKNTVIGLLVENEWGRMWLEVEGLRKITKLRVLRGLFEFQTRHL